MSSFACSEIAKSTPYSIQNSKAIGPVSHGHVGFEKCRHRPHSSKLKYFVIHVQFVKLGNVLQSITEFELHLRIKTCMDLSFPKPRRGNHIHTWYAQLCLERSIKTTAEILMQGLVFQEVSIWI